MVRESYKRGRMNELDCSGLIDRMTVTCFSILVRRRVFRIPIAATPPDVQERYMLISGDDIYSCALNNRALDAFLYIDFR